MAPSLFPKSGASNIPSAIQSTQVLYNPRRKVAYAINGAIPVLLPDEARKVSEGEHAQFTAAGAYVVAGTK